MSPRKTLALIDGHALAFRAFHAMREAGLRSSKGEPTYAVFGFAQILLSMIQEQQPEYVAVSFDIGRTFRDDLYAEYKAGRAETPEEFHPQLERIKQLVSALNIPIYVAEGYEADDVIGTLARQASAHDVATLILTGDTDSLQLVDEYVQVMLANPYGQKTTTTIYDEAKVRERYKGLAPDQLADLRGLKGDTSDNIPGVKGIGEAGAIALLMQFGTVENLYEHFEDAPNRYKKPLEGQRDAALFSKKLATIVTDAPVTLDLALAKVGDYDRAAVVGLFQELEIGARSGLLKKLPATGESPLEPLPAAPTAPTAPGSPQQDMFAEPLPASLPNTDDSSTTQQLSFFAAAASPPPPPITSSGDYHAIVDVEGLTALLAELRAAPGFAFDTEASGLRPFACELVGISFCVQPGTAYYMPLGHREGQQLDRAQALEAVRPLFEDARWAKYAHNAKFDIEVLLNAGLTVRGLTFDTMIAAGLLGKSPGLKDLSFYELKLVEPMTPIEDLIGRGSKQVTFDQVPVERAVPYAAADADMTMRLVRALEPQLADDPLVNGIFRRLEMPLIDVLVGMEHAGIGLDVAYIERLGESLGARIATLEQQIYEHAGKKFNINSGDQLSEVLFEGLKISAEGVGRTAKTKKYSLTADTIEQIRDRHPIFEQILLYRQLSKLKSTYVDALPLLANPETGRVHTSYNQIGAATGRLSSVDPNLQNIPIRTQEGREIRRAFVAAPGHCFVAADYSQIELRVLAHITKDPGLIEVFEQGQDIHAATAAQLFNVPMEQVDKNQRRVAKCVAAGTLVITERGILPIEQLATALPGQVADLSCEIAQEGNKRARATGFYNGGVQPTIRITTERGYVLEATAKHKVRTIDVDGSYIWSELGQLAVGEYVALARGALLFGKDSAFDFISRRRNDTKSQVPEHMTPTFARFLGYYVAEGNDSSSHSSKSVIINNNDPDVLADLRNLSITLVGRPPHELVDKNGVTRLSWHSSKLADLLEFLAVGSGAANKRIPDLIMCASYESVTEFLRAYFEGDGSISKSFISAASKSYTLIQQLQTLLLNLGIVAYLEHRDVPNYGRHYKLRIIGRESRENFATHIGFVSSRKRSRLVELLQKDVTHEPILLPSQVGRLKRMYVKTKRDLRETIHMCIRTKSLTVGLTYRRLGVISRDFPDQEDIDLLDLQAHRERNLFYDRIASIEHTESQVYDLIVPENNTYIANGFVSHNTVVFGVIYGISAFGLSQRLGMERGASQALINALFERFPGLRRYIDETLERGRRDGYVSTLFGRKRRMEALRASGPQRQAAEREAINAPIQGTAADLMKIAMINLAQALSERLPRTRMLLQVHDELILEAPEDEVAAAKALIREVMEGAYKLELPALTADGQPILDEEGKPVMRHIPLEVGVESGTSWSDMTEM